LRRFKYIARLALPGFILLFLWFYRNFVDARQSVPISITIGIGFLCGFLAPKGKWRWPVLIGLGETTMQLFGHLVDRSTPLPTGSLADPVEIAKNFVPVLAATYVGIFVNHRLYGSEPVKKSRTERKREKQMAGFEQMVEQYEMIRQLRGGEGAKSAIRSKALAKEVIAGRDPVVKPKTIKPILLRPGEPLAAPARTASSPETSHPMPVSAEVTSNSTEPLATNGGDTPQPKPASPESRPVPRAIIFGLGSKVGAAAGVGTDGSGAVIAGPSLPVGSAAMESELSAWRQGDGAERPFVLAPTLKEPAKAINRLRVLEGLEARLGLGKKG